jgi:hypothetical protein
MLCVPVLCAVWCRLQGTGVESFACHPGMSRTSARGHWHGGDRGGGEQHQSLTFNFQNSVITHEALCGTLLSVAVRKACD